MLPRLQKISRCCHDLGVYHLFASDGDLWPVADDLFGRSGIDGYYEIDKLAGMDLRRLREAQPQPTPAQRHRNPAVPERPTVRFRD